MPTYEGMAQELGVTKQTVRNWCKRLDPERAHIDTSGETHVIDEALASMVAHEVARRARDQGSARPREAVAALVEVSDGELERQRKEFNRLLEAMRDASGELLAEKDARISDLKAQLEAANAQLEQERAAHERTRRELAQARELEGFKWPWQKREIRARYMLPAPEAEA